MNVEPGRYRGTVRPMASGSEFAPIRFVAASGPVVVDAAGADVGLKLMGVDWLSFEGFAVTGASNQGVYVAGSTGVTLAHLSVYGNGTYGIQAGGSSLRVSASTISGNRLAGISELPDASGNIYEGNTISGNGKDGRPFNGDGIQLNGDSAVVRENAITDNGDLGLYEHGIYAGSRSSGYLIESNTLKGNAASDIKAAGSDGIVRYNRLGDSRLGLVFSDEARPTLAYSNLIVGHFQHAVFFTTGATAARARLWGNTIVQTGRLGVTGDASAVFISSAAFADLRNNLISYTNRDNLGAALFVQDASRGTVFSDANWLSDRDPHGRTVALNGLRTTLDRWTTSNGQDAGSLSSDPPRFDAQFHVISTNLGVHRGQPLPLDRDYAGSRISASSPDIGGYQTSR